MLIREDLQGLDLDSPVSEFILSNAEGLLRNDTLTEIVTHNPFMKYA